MQNELSIITITKDDLNGVLSTIKSIDSLIKDNRITHIVVDGSCADTSLGLKEKTKGIEHISYIFHPPDGISNAFNKGIRASKSQWLWFLNGGDTLYSEEHGELMMKIIKKSSADIVIFKIAYGDNLVERDFPPMWLQWPPVSSWIPHPSMIIRRDLFEKYGYFDSRYKGVMDFDKWLQMTTGNIKVDMVSIPLVIFDMNGFSSKQSQLIARECLTSIRRNSFNLLKTIVNRQVILLSSLLELIKTAYFKKK